MKRSVVYPEWAEKYRSKGRTIRKVRDGYGLYECTSVYVSGMKYPKSVQKYLGMITEKDGFIPKKDAGTVSERYLEYGLSHFLMANFKRDLMRSVYQSSDVIVLLGIVAFLFGDIDDIFIRSTYVTHGREKELIDRKKNGIASARIKTVTNRINKLIAEKVPDVKERNILIKLLFLTVIGNESQPESVAYLPEVRDISERHGLKL